jgi:hypothetical protein
MYKVIDLWLCVDVCTVSWDRKTLTNTVLRAEFSDLEVTIEPGYSPVVNTIPLVEYGFVDKSAPPRKMDLIAMDENISINDLSENVRQALENALDDWSQSDDAVEVYDNLLDG